MTGLGGVLLLLAGHRTRQQSLLLDLDHLERIAVSPLSRVFTLFLLLVSWVISVLFIFVR